MSTKTNLDLKMSTNNEWKLGYTPLPLPMLRGKKHNLSKLEKMSKMSTASDITPSRFCHFNINHKQTPFCLFTLFEPHKLHSYIYISLKYVFSLEVTSQVSKYDQGDACTGGSDYDTILGILIFGVLLNWNSLRIWLITLIYIQNCGLSEL